jgi:DNA-binding GntR family transcriptional regulator
MKNVETPKRRADTADRAFKRLAHGILSGALPIGAPLREARLAREWDISRTPLREAIRLAAAAGMVVLRPNQAPIVRHLTPADIEAIYDLRALLEPHALKLAWSRIDSAQINRLGDLEAAAARSADGGGRQWTAACLGFDHALHQTWTQRCGNSWLRRDIERQHHFWGIFQHWVARDTEALLKAYNEHVEILGALRSKDRSRARRLLRRHILSSAAAAKAARQEAQAL